MGARAELDGRCCAPNRQAAVEQRNFQERPRLFRHKAPAQATLCRRRHAPTSAPAPPQPGLPCPEQACQGVPGKMRERRGGD